MLNTNYTAPIPEYAVDYLKSKGYTASYYWHDTWKETHAHAFTVAKMLKLSLLQDVHTALTQALEEGQTYQEFSKNIIPVLQNSGWWGKEDMENPYNGKTETVQLGSPRRLETIYYTNMLTAYQAGHYKAMQEVKDTFPYWQYMAVDDGNSRHMQWHLKVFRADDPIWDIIYPPNDWRCRCSVRVLSEEMVKMMGLKVESSEGRIKSVDTVLASGEIRRQSVYTDPATNKQTVIGHGWDYNAGKSRTEPFVAKPYTAGAYGHKTVGLESDMEPISKASGMPIDKNRLLPAGKENIYYVNAFLKEFNAEIGKPSVFKDVVGDAVVISERLFIIDKSKGFSLDNIKADKADRGRLMLVLADAVKNPDEVWLTPEQRKDKTIFNKQYIKFFSDNDHAAGYILFELKDGVWQGRTVFPYTKNLEHQVDVTREFGNGSLLYKK